MLYRLIFRIRNLCRYYKLIWNLSDDHFTNTLLFLHFEILKIRDELYLNKDEPAWAEKLQDINFVLELLTNQINNDYFDKLKLNLDKYPQDTVDLGNGRFESREYRTIKEIEEDEEIIIAEEERYDQDLDNIFKILSIGMFFPDGIRSW